ncbi:MAG: hypothetical protein ACI9UQ_000284 [Candidatus Krumholzibacteriia bacterium]|jgi:hypothetical protein
MGISRNPVLDIKCLPTLPVVFYLGGRWPNHKSSGGSPMADMIISKSKTKETVKECNVSGEFYTALDSKVREMIGAAEKRAVENGRKTVRPCDL